LPTIEGCWDLAAFIFRCTNTGQRVQGWIEDNGSDDREVYKGVTCLVCGQLHFVNPKTGKTLGADDE